MAGYSLDVRTSSCHATQLTVLQDLDKHLDNLRAQLEFLNKSLDATDHNAPDWVATDLVSLRNKSGRLQDEMKRFRDQLESEGLATKKVHSARLHNSPHAHSCRSRSATRASAAA
jgi:hypothetical protein